MMRVVRWTRAKSVARASKQAGGRTSQCSGETCLLYSARCSPVNIVQYLDTIKHTVQLHVLLKNKTTISGEFNHRNFKSNLPPVEKKNQAVYI